MKRLIGCLIASSFLFCSNSALSQSQIDIPLIDAPYNADHPEQWPSMNQSLHWVRSTYAAAHHGLTQWRDEKGKNPTMWIIGFDFMMTWFPLGSSWLHEEWHRAVMGQYGIDSYDEVNDIPLFAETISVSHVKDEDLAWLKANHPADFVRLSSAGLEAQNELNFLVEQDQFFKDSPTDNLFLLWSNYINNWGYLDACASEDSTKITKELQDAEGANISKRDFTGLDCNAWVYDLFRPQEAYADRGLHPSGTGVRRYRTFEDLTQEEKDYLTKQSRLSLLNLVNPFLINRVHFSAQFEGRQVLWNASLRHHITPFGYNLGVNVFLRSADTKLLCTLNSFHNKVSVSPGVDCQLKDMKLNAFTWEARTALWAQPKDQSFYAEKSELGGLLSTRIQYPYTERLAPYLTLEMKTKGWVPGNVYLDESVSARTGLVYQLD